MGVPDFAGLPDLASRLLGGSVVAASDELFAPKENLILPDPPAFAAGEFGVRGKIYDGWETRRRRGAGHDHAVVRLGCPGVVHGVVVDTAFFRGNYPPEISVEATRADGYPSPQELEHLPWVTLVARSPASGDASNSYPVSDGRRWTHVRLSIYPDGGVARLRVHGEVVPDPAFLTETIDLAALENGGAITGCSDAFYSCPGHLIMPGIARVMSDGWENARRRGAGNDYVVTRLAGQGRVRHVEIDTTCFVGNAPGWAALSGADAPGPLAGGAEPHRGPAPPAVVLLPRTRVQPDTRHRFATGGAAEVSHVRLDVFPDGGLSRLRVFGELTPAGLAAARRRWDETATAGG